MSWTIIDSDSQVLERTLHIKIEIETRGKIIPVWTNVKKLRDLDKGDKEDQKGDKIKVAAKEIIGLAEISP
jgi:hypothetical protein